MAIYGFGEAVDINGVLYRVEIHDSTFVGSTVEFKLGKDIFNRQYDGYDEVFFTPLFTSKCIIPVIITDADTQMQALIDDLPFALENQYHVVIKKAGAVWFIGNLLCDMVQYDDNETYVVEFAAVDGLKRLENYTLDYVLTAADRITDMTVIIECLKFTKFDIFYTGSDAYIKSSINWYEIDQNTTRSQLEYTRMMSQLYVHDVEKNVAKTAKECLEIVLKKYGASIRFENGCWFICQFDNLYTQNLDTVFSYSKTGGYLSTASAVANDIVISGNNKPRATLVNSYKPMLRQVWLTAKGKSMWKSGTNTFAYNITDSITVNNITTFPLQISHDIEVFRPASLYPTNVLLTLRVELKFVTGGVTYYYQANDTGGVWSTNRRVVDRNIGVESIRYYKLNYIINPPTIALTGTFTYTITAFKKVARINQQLRGWTTVSHVIGVENSNENEIAYESLNNDNLEASYTIKEDIICYEDLSLPAAPEFVQEQPEVYNGTAWIKSTEWERGTAATSGVPLGVLLASEAQYHQRYPRKMTMGGFRIDSFWSYARLEWRSLYWVFLKGSFNAKMCEWDGEWMNILRQTNTVTRGSTNPFRDVFRDRDSRNDNIIGGLSYSVGELNDRVADLTGQVHNLVNSKNQNPEDYLLQNLSGLVGAGTEMTIKAGLVDGQYRLYFE